jgi:anti-anti-sigma factor
MTSLTITDESDGDAHTVRLVGALDVATVGRFEERLKPLQASRARRLVIDLSGLTFIDSSGVDALLRVADQAKPISLVRGPAHVHRVFELAGLDDVLPFTDDP